MDEIRQAEQLAKNGGSIDEILSCLRPLGLKDFGEILIRMPDPEYPYLSRTLPKMADEQIQRNWTGNAGQPLLLQSLVFVGDAEENFRLITGSGLEGKTILDFGCGYGRLMRLMYFFSSPSRIWGVDPWTRSIEICKADRMLGHLAVSDYLPVQLPVGETCFDLVFAFSVFTHLSERATLQAFAALRRHMAPGGVLAITIRPEDYWRVAAPNQPHVDAANMLARHRDLGFAFTPHGIAPVDGDVTYGDSSMTMDWIRKVVPGWKVSGEGMAEPMQRIVYITPV